LTPASFAGAVLDWFAGARRDLPWRDVDDGYAVLVSEIMLQQTQVSRVLPLYEAFLKRWPTATALAAASRADVLRAWQGLGYNRRAVALHRAAAVVVSDHGGVVPDDFDALRRLPGVGEYTARAILAFAFDHDVAPVDTNIRRVLCRAVVGAPLRGRELQALADNVMPLGHGRDWSAALMDLGATFCTSRPRCGECPLAPACAWRGRGDDPAAVERSPSSPVPFVGSTRYHRGRLLDALRSGPLERAGVTAAALLDDHGRAQDLAAGLVSDGLAEWHGDELRLPA
jgi:A/G-specific adenine glycosylase